MITPMLETQVDITDIAAELRADPAALAVLVPALSDADAAALVEYLKAEADRHWWINAHSSLELAELIERIGRERNDLRQVALGTMACGDALKHLGRLDQAWARLDEAGRTFLAAGDEIGWARTRIGRLYISVDLGCVQEALADADRARAIFARHGDFEKQVRLDLNTGYVFFLLGNQQQAIAFYQRALATATALRDQSPESSEFVITMLGLLYTNMGISHSLLGDFQRAVDSHEQARSLFERRGDTAAHAMAELNIAHIAIAQGHYRRALQLLHRARAVQLDCQLPMNAAYVERDIVECYLHLNRYEEARTLAERVSASFRSFGTAYEESLSLLHLATAEAELGRFEAAQQALTDAERILAILDAHAWVATVHLRRGRVALKQGEIGLAEHEALVAQAGFETFDQTVGHASARLLFGQARLVAGDDAAANEAALAALRIARRANVPELRYRAHLLLGRIAEACGHARHARRRYSAAVATVERVQRGLTITLRPGFLEDKGEALRGLIRLQLAAGNPSRAFEALERAKSQALLGYLADREALRWSRNDPHSQELIAELDQLRGEHQWFYRLANELSIEIEGQRPMIDPAAARAELASRERRIRAITEQLYLDAAAGTGAQVAAPPARVIQASLDERTTLVEFYNDGTALWAFTLDRTSLEAHLLPATVTEVDHLIAQLQANVEYALSSGPDALRAGATATLARRLLQRLYMALMAPLAGRIASRRRLVIVPYGALHYLPFHLLHDGAGYLIEQHEIVVLPAAALAVQRGPSRSEGALVLAHSWGGRLPQTCVEAGAVAVRTRGLLYCEEEATRERLQAQPAQVLHIAAHGRHRLDQPDLSYIELADGQLYSDDLLQLDLSYELVTLSACETGRANVAAGDELIGLGRGFLYAGAGALITSLWRVADDTALALMEHVYASLAAGASKVAALRDAQLALLEAAPLQHPAFWGAFQLVGDPRPLSGHHRC